jgi:hypothetical protein
MVRLIQVLPTIIGSIFDSTSGVVDSIILKCVALVLLLLGLLKFAQDAPKLFKDMFTVGGDMLKGMDFSANPKKHIESNKYGMAAMTGLAGGAAGFLGGMRNAYTQSKANHNAGTNDVQFKDYLRGGMGGLRGAVTGAVNGAKNANEHLTIDDFKKSAIRDSEYARKEYNNGNYFENVGRKIQEINADGSMNDKDKRRAYGRAIIDPYAKKGEKTSEKD